MSRRAETTAILAAHMTRLLVYHGHPKEPRWRTQTDWQNCAEDAGRDSQLPILTLLNCILSRRQPRFRERHLLGVWADG
jgi:hypothetical protein